jgi:hypothetical protein
VNEKTDKDELRIEIEEEQFQRAATLAASCGASEEEIQDLRLKALWQMAAVYRNAHGTKILAQQYGVSKQELMEFLKKYAEDNRNEGNSKALEPCYDIGTGKYLSFEEWMERFLKTWDKLRVS